MTLGMRGKGGNAFLAVLGAKTQDMGIASRIWHYILGKGELNKLELMNSGKREMDEML
jgi:hypothetical protein